ncbi:methylated-DNA--[protein]-cysteine S-methyltransferase [Rhodococcoides kyotonense]|uniref:methylated-DNA--[protein]-cysteine S-methyltransferase n=1 Tax=Rhodococcoides kyotonense TaxID=398843 RepID=A0A239GGB8_9NOCA|nr:methylated-DNA--[protein]-cysteine S-methyltransferase [Rhodococcus kyotonensis]SNS68179.1 methylated-DNA-[protein]-cysteine S-methyltransferase [Rhodococcus kyotonensis]
MPYVLFDTSIGRCGLAWSDVGITAVALPEPEDDLVRYLRGFAPGVGELDALAADAVALIGALLGGSDPDMSSIPVVLDVSPFDKAVYDATRAIPRGATLTYGAVARQLGQPGAAQAVGGALGRNPVPIIIPCHRVLGAGREVGGFSAPGGASTKEKILAIEGVAGFGEPTLF